MTTRRVLLVEPGYRNKYPPLGLMKIAQYHRERRDTVRFVKGVVPEVVDEVWDRVYVTTLFSFEWKRTSEAIDFAIEAAGRQVERVFVGGIAASLMLEQFVQEPRWAGVRFIPGLLERGPADALNLRTEDGDFGADDRAGVPIEYRIPDYGILDDISYTYPVRDAYFAYASRGCVRKCHFCGVPKLEGAQKEMPPLTALVEGVTRRYGEKKDMILMDNNVTASARYREVIAEIRSLGFGRDAQLDRDGRRVRRRVDFNQGVDARILAQSPVYLREMATICISPLRIAFDHMGLRKCYETSVRMAWDSGIDNVSNYMLYNFMDSPRDLYARMRLNISLREDLGVRIWSFPMRYQPVNLKDRSHVGPRWNRYMLRSFQLMLQATHGVVSGSPSFFQRAYGPDEEVFLELLSYPHRFIFFRNWYEFGDGAAEREAYQKARRRLSASEENELWEILCRGSGGDASRRRFYLREAGVAETSIRVREVLSYYGGEERGGAEGPNAGVEASASALQFDDVPPVEEAVEDAGLYAD